MDLEPVMSRQDKGARIGIAAPAFAALDRNRIIPEARRSINRCADAAAPTA